MNALHPAADLIVSFLVVLGASFALIGSWGLARLPSLVTRLHGPTKATTVGVGSCLIASMIYFPATGGAFSAHELLITLFLFVTAPISANMLAKAHLHLQRSNLDAGESDAAESLPPTGRPFDWATFSCGGEEAQAAGGDPASPKP